MALPNTYVYEEEWAIRLQEELDEPNKWKDICRVEYTNDRLLHNPYLTDATVQTGERDTPYTYQAVVHTDESVTYSTFKIIPQFIDRASLAQSQYLNQMEVATRQAVLLNEEIEKGVYDDYTNFTVFDGDEIGGAAGSITPSSTNIDDIIRGVKREIYEASGQSLYERNGGFFVWRPADFEYLEQFAQANGFQLADNFLANGMKNGVNYGGFTHYTSNLLNGGHIFAGVKKVHHLGILKATYGQIMVDPKDPSERSGIGIVSRVDFGVKTWTKVKPVLFDVRLA